MHVFKKATIITVIAATFIAISPPAFAVDSPTTTTETHERTSPARGADDTPETQMQTSERKATARSHLADAKLKACQKREQAITNIMDRIASRGQKQLDLFTAIENKTKAFYNAKRNPLATYDALVAEADAKRVAAQAAVDSINGQKSTFTCEGDNPKGTVQSFKDSLRAETTALKNYKTAVKDLIVGVKSSQGQGSSDKTTQGEEQ